MASENPYRYAGYRYDEETGLYYLNARYYDAEIGRFITRDVVQTLNLYSYAEGNPVRFIDSSGHFICDVLDIFSLAYSAKDFWNNPGLLTGAFLIWDIAALLPAVPGSYVADGANALNKGMDLQLFARSKLGKLTSTGDGIWKSSAGLIYGADKKFGNRVKHVLAHGITDSSKAKHTVFNVGKDKILGLVDEAWLMKGNPLPDDPAAYLVPMGRTIGINGETTIKIIVKPGTSEIITAYPFK